MRVSINLTTQEALEIHQLAKKYQRTVAGEVTVAVVYHLLANRPAKPETPLEAVPDDRDPF